MSQANFPYHNHKINLDWKETPFHILGNMLPDGTNIGKFITNYEDSDGTHQLAILFPIFEQEIIKLRASKSTGLISTVGGDSCWTGYVDTPLHFQKLPDDLRHSLLKMADIYFDSQYTRDASSILRAAESVLSPQKER